MLLILLTSDIVALHAEDRRQSESEFASYCSQTAHFGECATICRTALNGFNELFRHLPFPDVQGIEERGRQVALCNALDTDTTPETIRGQIVSFLYEYQSEAVTALACDRAISETRAGGMSVGSPAYMSRFEQLNCLAYAKAMIDLEEDRRACQRQRGAFEKAMKLEDLDTLRRFDGTFACSQYNADLFLRIREMERLAQAAAPKKTDQDAHSQVIGSASQIVPPNAQTGTQETRDTECRDATEAWRSAMLASDSRDLLDLGGMISTSCSQRLRSENTAVARAFDEVMACTRIENLLAQSRYLDDTERNVLLNAAVACPPLMARATARIMRDAGAAEQEKICEADTAEANKLVGSGGALLQLRQIIAGTRCTSLRERAADLEKTLCSLQQVRFGNHLVTTSDTADTLKATYDCPDLIVAIDDRFALVDKARRHQQACDEDQQRFVEIDDSYPDLVAFQSGLVCTELAPMVSAAIDGICAAELRNLSAYTVAGAGNIDAYLAVHDAARCDQTKARILAVVTEMQVEQTCAAEQLELERLPGNDLDRLRRFLSTSTCSSLRPTILARIAQAEAGITCDTERAALNALGSDDVAGLAALKDRSQCAGLAGVIGARLVEAEALVTCRSEGTRLAALKAGRADIGQMRTFAAEVSCATVRDEVLASIAEMEQTGGDQEREVATVSDDAIGMPDLFVDLAPANSAADAVMSYSTDEITRGVQTELKRLGCYSGNIDGNFGNRSLQATRDYFRVYRNMTQQAQPDLPFWQELQKVAELRTCVEVAQRPATPATGNQASESRAPSTSQPSRPTTTPSETSKPVLPTLSGGFGF